MITTGTTTITLALKVAAEARAVPGFDEVLPVPLLSAGRTGCWPARSVVLKAVRMMPTNGSSATTRKTIRIR